MTQIGRIYCKILQKCGARYFRFVMACCVLISTLLAGMRASPINIITILTDDQGFGDSSYNCENSTGMCAQTPNLDALALSNSSALFSRFYSAAGVCSPTRAAYLTGRTNERSCIFNALRCDQEDPAPGCSMGKGLPWGAMFCFVLSFGEGMPLPDWMSACRTVRPRHHHHCL